MKGLPAAALAAVIAACSTTDAAEATAPSDESAASERVVVDPARGLGFEGLDARFADLIDTAAGVEVLAEGFDWSEGPVWVPSLGALLCSDVPGNVVYRWAPGAEGLGGGGIAGADTFLFPSGYFADPTIGGEPGANGLLLDADGRLLLAQHGERQVARLELTPAEALASGYAAVAKTDFTPLATTFEGAAFNSPNDLTQLPDGRLLFTDPTYGVDKTFGEDARALDDEAVYAIDPAADPGTAVRVFAGFDRPNGVAATPAGDSFFVASSVPGQPQWVLCPVPDASGATGPCRNFADASELAGEDNPGNADGLVVLAGGELLASGPGGVLLYDRAGTHLGTIRTGRATANVTTGGADGLDIFVTADDLLLRARLKR